MQLSEKEYLELVRIADDKIKYMSKNLVYVKLNEGGFKESSTRKVQMQISGVDVIHDLIIKLHEKGDYAFKDVNEKINSHIKSIYWDNRNADNPFLKEASEIEAKYKYIENKQDNEFVKKYKKRNKEYYYKKKTDIVFIEKRKTYHANWFKKKSTDEINEYNKKRVIRHKERITTDEVYYNRRKNKLKEGNRIRRQNPEYKEKERIKNLNRYHEKNKVIKNNLKT